MKKLILKFWPVLSILALWFIFSAPYFLQGRVPYSSTYQVNFFPPWSHYEKFWGPVKNNAMPDVHGQMYPWKKFTIDTYKIGQIPLWNPNNFSGNPHLANVQSAVLSPFNTLFLILPFIDAWSILILLQPLLAGLFMYLFARSLSISKMGSAIGAVIFMFCGFIVVWMAYGTLAFAISYLPLALFAVNKYKEIYNKKFLSLLIVTIPLSFFSGHFQISLYFLGSVLLYIVYTTWKHMRKFFLPLGVAFIIGFILSLPQLLPAVEFYKNSVRSETFLLTESIPAEYLPTMIASDFYGNPVTRNDWFGHYAEWASFIGITGLLLVLFGVSENMRKRSFFIILAIVSLILAVKSPLSPFVVALKIPVISTSAQSRIIVLFSFAAAVLAGFGFDTLQKLLSDKKTKKILSIILLAFLFLLLCLGLALFLPTIPKDKIGIALKSLRLPAILFLINVGAIFLALRYKHIQYLLLSTILFTTVVHSFYFAHKWMPFDPKNLVYPDVPVIEGIKKNIGYGRIFGNIGAEVTSYYQFPSIEGYDPLYIDRYGEFIRTGNSGIFQKGERSVVRLARAGKYTDRVLDLLGVGLIFHPIADTDQGWAYAVWKDKKRYEVVYEDDKFQLFKNKEALPRPALFYDYEVIPDGKNLLSRFYSDSFDFRHVLLLEEDPHLDKTKEASGSAIMEKYTPDKIVIQVETNVPALLFLSDNFYPNWKAQVNGADTKILRADYSFRTIVVPKGKSKVEFSL